MVHCAGLLNPRAVRLAWVRIPPPPLSPRHSFSDSGFLFNSISAVIDYTDFMGRATARLCPLSDRRSFMRSRLLLRSSFNEGEFARRSFSAVDLCIIFIFSFVQITEHTSDVPTT